MSEVESRIDQDALNAMIFPPGSNPDYSPLHVVCCNDTCSFTWTGAEHINQVTDSQFLLVSNYLMNLYNQKYNVQI